MTKLILVKCTQLQYSLPITDSWQIDMVITKQREAPEFWILWAVKCQCAHTDGDRLADQTWRYSAVHQQWVKRCIDSTITTAESRLSDALETMCICVLSLVDHNMMSHDPIITQKW